MSSGWALVLEKAPSEIENKVGAVTASVCRGAITPGLAPVSECVGKYFLFVGVCHLPGPLYRAILRTRHPLSFPSLQVVLFATRLSVFVLEERIRNRPNIF